MVNGAKLRQVRESRGYDIRKLSQVADVGIGTISNIESGKTRNPGMLTLQKLAGALQVDLSDLLEPMA